MNSDYDYLFRIHLVGSLYAGKSTIMRRICDRVFYEQERSRIGVDFKIRTINLNDKVVKIQIWDTAGQEGFKTIVNSYYRGAHGFMLVYSIDDRQSFVDIEHWLAEVNKNGNEKVVKILIGNKCDLEEQREVRFAEGKAYADEKGMKFFEVSAKTEEHIEETLFSIVGGIKAKVEDEEQENIKVTGGKKTQSDSKRTGCWQ